MKYLVGIVLVLLSLSANAGIWSAISTSNWDEVDAVHYKVEMHGFDARIYEWKSKSLPNWMCTAIASEKSGLQPNGCYKVK